MKKGNEYQQVLDPEFFEKIPKTVLAALAVSLQGRIDGGTIDREATTAALRNEWNTLYQNGIVPQKPHVG